MAVLQVVDFDFGQVSLQRDTRSKYMRLKVHPEKGVIVSIPRGVSENQAIDFVKRKQDWIKKSLKKTEQVANKFTRFIPETPFATKYHKLSLQPHAKKTLKFEVKDSLLIVYYPGDVSVHHEKVQAFIRHAITETMRFEAKKYLPVRTREIASKYKLPVGEVSVRNNKTRWGSCSGKNNISLNIHLMRLPDELIDYVIYHELAHIKVKSHGKPFWQYMELILPGARRIDKKLNKYHLVYW
jgi:predicted metal-dependent hydrolase